MDQKVVTTRICFNFPVHLQAYLCEVATTQGFESAAGYVAAVLEQYLVAAALEDTVQLPEPVMMPAPRRGRPPKTYEIDFVPIMTGPAPEPPLRLSGRVLSATTEVNMTGHLPPIALNTPIDAALIAADQNEDNPDDYWPGCTTSEAAGD